MSQLKKRLRTILVLIVAVTLLAGLLPAAGVGETGSQEETETVSGYPYTTKTRVKVNLRAGRSVRSALLRHVPAGAEITVNAVKGSWAEVEYGKYSGYMKTEYIVLKEIKKTEKATATPTPAPTLSPEEDAGGYKILQKGDEGDDVRALQEALIELGFLSGTADGKFGIGTQSAVVAFQTKNEYPATGIMDANIQAFLYTGQPKNVKGEKTSVKTLSPVDGVSMKKGNKGFKVQALQVRLQELGYYKGTPTGTYDTVTIGAVRSFQKKNGLKADGTAGSETQKAIYADTAIPASATATPKATTSPTPSPTVAVPTEKLQAGDTGTDVKTIQTRLKALGYYKSVIDGKFGRDTTNALKDFQEANGLTPDGVAGKATYEKLFSDSALAKGTTPTPAATATPAPTATNSGNGVTWVTLRKGDKGDSVAQLQEALIQLKYLSGKADGNFGENTEKAVKAFQKANGLSADGEAGAKTQTLLYSGKAKAASATATPKASATPAPTNNGTLRSGDKGTAVKTLQKKLIELGYLKGSADGVYGPMTVAAVKAYQRAKNLTADGVAGAKTLASLKITNTGAGATATPTPAPSAAATGKPSASQVQYANWYDTIKAVARKYPYATVYDIATGISWQIHIFSVGAHADYEPVTASDTAKLEKAFGGNTWNPRAVWVKFSNGSVYIGSTHSKPHDVQHITDNNFPGHSCLHFPRTQAQVTAIGSYATSHQETIDAGWATTLKMR